ncbi:MAG: glycosyltransferase involved in cell wall biosynthesis [Pseudomonadales bacterium]|jgi:glycosyltransferase involved in cell wall biosynthesis
MELSALSDPVGPLISIVTVVYCAKSDLELTVSSVRSQTYKNIEYIVVDGGSSDGTTDVIEGNLDIISPWLSEPDSGIYDAMNKAISMSSGEWVLFLNAGDEFAAESVVSDLVAEVSDDYDFVYGDRYRIEAGGSATYERAGPIEETLDREVIFHQSLLNRTSILKARPYVTFLSLAADYEYMAYAHSTNYRFLHLTFPVSKFKSGGRSRQQHMKAMIEALKVVFDCEPDGRKARRSYIFRNFILRHIEFVLHNLAQDWLKRGEDSIIYIKALPDKNYKFEASPEHQGMDNFFKSISSPLNNGGVAFSIIDKRPIFLDTASWRKKIKGISNFFKLR